MQLSLLIPALRFMHAEQEPYLVTKAAQGVLAEVRRQVLPAFLASEARPLALPAVLSAAAPGLGRLEDPGLTLLPTSFAAPLACTAGCYRRVVQIIGERDALAHALAQHFLQGIDQQDNVAPSSAAHACRPIASLHCFIAPSQPSPCRRGRSEGSR